MSATCRSCGARVVWAKSAATGKWMILDEAPTPDGNVVLTVARQYGRHDAHVYRDAASAEEAHPGEARWLDHHVTCPQAKQWREKGRADGQSAT